MSIWSDFTTNWDALLGGLLVSLKMAGCALLLGLAGGLLLAVAMLSKNVILRSVSIVLVEAGRGAPALVVLQIVYFGLPQAGMTLGAFICAVIALGITTAAYTAEIMRGGFQAVPQGEIEAGEALGMRRGAIMRHVVVPQGIRIATPALMGFAIIIFQATSLTLYLGGQSELMRIAKSQGSQTFQYFNFFVIAAILYAAITIPASFATERLERRLARHL